MEFSAHQIWLWLILVVKKKREARLAEPSLISSTKRKLIELRTPALPTESIRCCAGIEMFGIA